MTDNISRRIAVIDIGKTNAKVVVVDTHEGAEIAARKTPNRVIDAAPYPHYDAEGLWRFILDALGELTKEPGYGAISITTHGASAALVDARGDLALPVLDYEFEYPAAIRDAYDSLRPAFDETGSPRLPCGLNLGAQLHYQKSAFPELFGNVRSIMTYPQYWAWRLTGVASVEATSLGCHTDLWNPRAGHYSPLPERLGIADLLAPVRPAFDILGHVLPEIAAVTGAVPVCCGIHDSNASLLAHLSGRSVPFSVVSTGTWVVSFAVGGTIPHLDPQRDTLINVDAYGRPVASARFMGGREFEMLGKEWPPADGDAVLAAVEEVLDRQIMLLPSFVAGSGPFADASGGWVNDDDVSPAGRQAAISLYLALMSATCLELIGADGPILVEGPFAANKAYIQALADICGRETVALAHSTGTSMGASLLAGHKGPADAGQRHQPCASTAMDLYRETWLRLASPAA